MGEGTNRVDEPSADELAEKVERSRERLDTLVAELDQRRHVFSRLEDMFGRHKVWMAAAGLLALGAIAAAVQLTLQHRRRQRTFRARLGRLSQALVRMARKPERIARNQPNLANKVLAAAATSLTSTVVKRAGARALPDQRR